MNQLTFREYLKSINEFAEKNPDCLDLQVVRPGDKGYHLIFHDDVIEKGVFQNRMFYQGYFTTIMDYEEEDEFICNAVNIVK